MAEFRPQGQSGQGAGRSHEPSRTPFREIVRFGIVLALILAALVFFVRILLKLETRTLREGGLGLPVAELRAPVPEPRLETDPALDLERERRLEDRQLETYGWVDRERRIFRIPIQEAMDNVLRRGLPARIPARPAE